MSLDILKILEDKETYDKYFELVKKHNLYSDKHKLIFDSIGKYYEAFPTDIKINWDKFETWFWVAYPVMKQDKKDLYNTIINGLKTLSIEDDLKEKVVEEWTVRSYASQIADLALRIVDGEDLELDDITTITDKCKAELKDLEADEFIVTSDMADIVTSVVAGGGLDWRLNYLNQMVGPIRKGDLILIGARPETGKTTFLASEGTNFITQLPKGKPLVWFNNEEEGRKVKFRAVQAALGWDTEKMVKTPPKDILEAYEATTGKTVAESLIIFDKARITIRDIEKVLDKYDAGVVIFDQLRKVRGFTNASNELHRLAALYQFAREVAKEVAPVISVHQARGDAEGVRYIAQNQLEGSQTEVQGEIDLQLMIGRSLDPSYEHNRFFNIVKNKLAGGPKVIKGMRHGQFECMINPDIARYEMPKGLVFDDE